jgi:hypothetical protein
VHALVGALEESDAEFNFKLADLAAERRLADVAHLRCPAKMPVFGYGNEIAEFLEVHGQRTGNRDQNPGISGAGASSNFYHRAKESSL